MRSVAEMSDRGGQLDAAQTAKELQALTGYIRGGVTALAGKKDYPVYVDETIELFDIISISAGMRGLQILLAPSDYLMATEARLTSLAHPK